MLIISIRTFLIASFSSRIIFHFPNFKDARDTVAFVIKNDSAAGNKIFLSYFEEGISYTQPSLIVSASVGAQSIAVMSKDKAATANNSFLVICHSFFKVYQFSTEIEYVSILFGF